MNLLFTDPFFFGNYDAEGIIIVTVYALISIAIVLSYFLRTIFPFNYIWWFTKWLLITLLIMLSINYIKKEVKEWWEK